MLKNAPPASLDPVSTKEADESSHRRPVEGPCPVCFGDLETSTEEVIWCKAACGKNLHKSCWDTWAATRQGKAALCVLW